MELPKIISGASLLLKSFIAVMFLGITIIFGLLALGSATTSNPDGSANGIGQGIGIVCFAPVGFIFFLFFVIAVIWILDELKTEVRKGKNTRTD